MLSDTRLREVAERLVAVPGVVAVLLGGSRARGAERPDSDVDLGLYYRPPLDVEGLQRLAGELAEARSGSAPPQLTQPGEWGRWVDGGGWLSIDGMAVDWLYRDVERVHTSWNLARQGVVDFHFQVGHPLGVPDFAYAGEVALGVVLADPAGELTALRSSMAYPPALAEAVVGRLGEAEFVLAGLDKPAGRGDVTFVAGSLFRVVGLCAHAVHARAGRWVVSEKGLVGATALVPGAPDRFAERAHGLLAGLGSTPEELRRAVAAARALLADVVAG